MGPDNRVMPSSTHPVVTVTTPTADTAQRVLWAYFDDVASRYYGRDATDDEIAAAMQEDPSDDLAPPHGLLLIAQQNGDVLGCAGLRLIGSYVAEVKRLFVMPAARRLGLGSHLIECLEDHARQLAVTTMRLDTRSDLLEARRLYARHGYYEVPPFNNGPYADHWFEKTLSLAPPSTHS